MPGKPPSEPDKTPAADSGSWTVYIIETRDGLLYTGITTDLDRRFSEHCSGIRGAKFFRRSPPRLIVHTEGYDDRGSAMRRECAIKKMARADKLALIAGSHP